ncbi:outer membrane lipoprotein-sorting protein [Nevskia sp.]|uniref:outer membrane lipoprotein-sorting protein n=1 Tax=Nevskia sp. TaxID=1929292 RepID=UPI0025EA7AFB|nr:outer membrane lipoprotein-sorting protein [Nevskia sp.]
MNRNLRLLAVLLLLVGPRLTAAEAPKDPAALIEASRQTVLMAGARIDYRFDLVSASGSKRLRRVSSLFRTDAGGDTTRLARYEYPEDARGLATLLAEHRSRDNELWVYVPAVKKTRRLVADNERDSFLGTVLSNGDVLGYKTAQWTHAANGEEVIDGRPCWRIVSTPGSEAVKRASGYSRRETWIAQDTSVVLQMSAWDEADRPLKTIHYRDLKPVAEQAGKWLPYRIEADNLAGGGSTLIAVERFEFVAKVDDEALLPSSLADEP